MLTNASEDSIPEKKIMQCQSPFSLLLSLPDELLTLLCAHLTSRRNFISRQHLKSRRSILDFMQICHRLYTIGEPFLFVSIDYQKRHSSLSLLSALKKNAERPLWVRELRVEYYICQVSPLDHQSDLLSMIPLFVNLEGLELHYRHLRTSFPQPPTLGGVREFIVDLDGGPGYPVTGGPSMIDTLKRLFVGNVVMARGPLDTSDVAFTKSPATSGALSLAPDLAQSPQCAFNRLRHCKIYGDKFDDELKIWGGVLASGTIRSLTLVDCDVDDTRVNAGQHTTPLQELVLNNCYVHGSSLRQIMAVPKALRKFILLSPTLSREGSCSQDLLDAIRLQEHSLQWIEMDGYFNGWDREDKVDVKYFDDFEHLQMLLIEGEAC